MSGRVIGVPTCGPSHLGTPPMLLPWDVAYLMLEGGTLRAGSRITPTEISQKHDVD